MASFKVKGTSDYAKKLDKLAANAPKVAKEMVYAAAGIVADEISNHLNDNLSDSEVSKGDLLDSFGIAAIDVDKRGNTNTKIGFDGYDSKGVANALKARAMESGTSTQPKKPFVRPALNKSKDRAIDEMGKVLDAEFKVYSL